jgi:hypothetical protein
MKFIARITVLLDYPSISDTLEAHNAIAEVMSARPGVLDWDYVSIDGEKTGPMMVESPDINELFDAALDNA